jgi:hypothetical protein
MSWGFALVIPAPGVIGQGAERLLNDLNVNVNVMLSLGDEHVVTQGGEISPDTYSQERR